MNCTFITPSGTVAMNVLVAESNAIDRTNIRAMMRVDCAPSTSMKLTRCFPGVAFEKSAAQVSTLVAIAGNAGTG